MKTIEEITLEVAEAPGNQEGVIEFAVAVHNAWLAQQEPVGWMNPMNNVVMENQRKVMHPDRYDNFSLPLFLAPTPAKQKPVAWRFVQNGYTHYTDDKRDWYDATGIEEVTPLYELPAQGEKP